ncbi:MAG: hypothetical protein AAF960_17495 [Bacteroidota bacterium]
MLPLKVHEEFVDFLAGYEPNRIINFHPSSETQERAEALLLKKQNQTLTKEEKYELDYYLMLEHIIRLAKAKALKRLAA